MDKNEDIFRDGFRRYLLTDPKVSENEAAAFAAGFMEACAIAGLDNEASLHLLHCGAQSGYELVMRGAEAMVRLDAFHKAKPGTVQ